VPTAKTQANTTHTTELKSISVRLENRPGALAEAARTVAQAGVNIEGVEAEVLGQYGFFRFYTKDETKAEEALKKAGYIVTVTEILEVTLADRPGELARVFEILFQGNVNGESCFGASLPNQTSRFFLRVSDFGKAHRLLAQAGIKARRLAQA